MKIPDHAVARTINLLFNVGFAVRVPWLEWPRSIFGNLSAYGSPPNGFQTELAALSPLSLRALESAACAVVPFARRVLEKKGSGPLAPWRSSVDQHPKERWLFINGVCTDQRIARLNAEMLTHMFGRSINILYNATDGIGPDLFECALGKGFNAITEAVAKNLMPLVQALCDPNVERVVLVSHSQGTILASIMLKWLEEVLPPGPRVKEGPGDQKHSPERRTARRLAGKDGADDPNYGYARAAHDLAKRSLEADHIGKLELYCFANCSTATSPIVAVGNPVHHAPWIESYGNEFDLVARLGVLAPPHGIGSARIEGDRYRRNGAWGHLLNAHYLLPMLTALAANPPRDADLTPFAENLLETPRLCGYYNGGTPPLPYP